MTSPAELVALREKWVAASSEFSAAVDLFNDHPMSREHLDEVLRLHAEAQAAYEAYASARDARGPKTSGRGGYERVR